MAGLRLGLLAAATVLLAILISPAVNAFAKAQRPNVVLIQTDDQTLRDLRATWRTPSGALEPVMPKTLSLIGNKGVTFDRYYSSFPLCGPSRATLLSGSYAHNDGVRGNSGTNGGWDGFRTHDIYSNNLATWLQQAGYRTIHVGKFTNNYGRETAPETRIPPGWDQWETSATDNSTREFYGYRLNVNGEIQGPFGESDYGPYWGLDDPRCPDLAPVGIVCNDSTDLTAIRASAQIAASPSRTPLYLQLDFGAPHGDSRPPIGPTPPTRYIDSAFDTALPRSPSFNEADISDKPSFLRDQAESLSPFAISDLTEEYRRTIETLRGVDDGVGRVLDALRSRGDLSNTYVIFTSDNGFFRGEHRIERAKFLPYEPSTHLPLLIRGPGIKPRGHSPELVANTDLAPTILKIAAAKATRSLDGRNLAPFWRNRGRTTNRPILLESFVNSSNLDPVPPDDEPADPQPRHSAGGSRRGATASISAPVKDYLGVIAGRYKYVEYDTGDRELYDLKRDPDELINRISAPRYARVQKAMVTQLVRLRTCKGASCKIEVQAMPKPGLSTNSPHRGSR